MARVSEVVRLSRLFRFLGTSARARGASCRRRWNWPGVSHLARRPVHRPVPYARAMWRFAGLKPDNTLAAWLYEVACRTAIAVVSGEARRQLRERIASDLNVMNTTADDYSEVPVVLPLPSCPRERLTTWGDPMGAAAGERARPCVEATRLSPPARAVLIGRRSADCHAPACL